MHCKLLFTLSAFASLANAEENNTGGTRRLVQNNRSRQERSTRGGLSSTTNYESVSAEPLTFTYTEHHPVIDRERILAEAEINGEDWEGSNVDVEEGSQEQEEDFVDEDALLLDEDEDVEYMDLVDMEEWNTEGPDEYVNYDPDAETEYEFVYTDMEEDVVPFTETSSSWDDVDDEDEEEYIDEVGEVYDDMEEDVLPFNDDEEEDFLDVDGEEDEGSESVTEEEFEGDLKEDRTINEDGEEEEEEMEGEGSEEVDTDPLIFYLPLEQRLRRLVAPVIVNEKDEDDVERYLAEKESFRDENFAIFDPALDANDEFELHNEDPEYYEDFIIEEEEEGHRDLQSGCKWNQKRAMIHIKTDNSGFETRWEIRRSNGALVTRGPPANQRYADNRTYSGGICLNAGTYRFTVYDRFNDGMCGSRTGMGWYQFYLGGVKRFTSPASCNVNWGKRIHTFRVNQPSRPVYVRPNPAPAPAPQPSPAAISGRGGCSNVVVQFKTDKFGKETTAQVTGGGRTHMISRNEVGAYQTKTMSKCLPPGTYTFKMIDSDGICCRNGNGWYKMMVNGVPVVTGGYFVQSKSHIIRIGSNWQAYMSSRAREWLTAHNVMRRKYNGGKGYIPQRWSRTLATQAQGYANQLGQNCKYGALVHAKGISDGENLAKNQGSGSYGQLYSAAQIMRRWVTNELNLPYPKNAHYSQVVWRSSQYVGCGESVKQYGNQFCRVQVCRYARPGNCNVRNGNWKAEAWKDDTGCGRPCPSEGCFV